MKNLNRYSFGSFIAVSLLIAVSPAFGQQNLSLTVTNQNLALVREVRLLELNEGRQDFKLRDIPEQIIPSSILIDRKNGEFQVLEQNYEYDLMNVDKVLDKSIDQQVKIVHPEQGVMSGKLLSASSGHVILLDQENQLQIIPRNDEQKIYLQDYDQQQNQFVTKPTLFWLVDAQQSGQQEARLVYLSRGVNWEASYVGRLNDDDSELKLACWVTLENKSGKAYRDVRLKLMAGDLNLGQQKKRRQPEMLMAMARQAQESGFEEKAFFEYHLYTLQRRTTIENNQIKQIELFPESTGAVNKLYRVDSQGAEEVNVLISFKNTEENNLGIPLPAGTLRLYKSDGEDMEFIGQDEIDHTPKNEDLEVRVGQAFDIVSERNVKSTRRPTKRTEEKVIVYNIRNHKEEDVKVEIIERVSPYQENKLISSSIEPFEVKAGFFKFKVPVKANGETELRMETLRKW